MVQKLDGERVKGNWNRNSFLIFKKQHVRALGAGYGIDLAKEKVTFGWDTKN